MIENIFILGGLILIGSVFGAYLFELIEEMIKGEDEC
jgi:hypothetical protein